jgi:hypothetical protein
MKFRTWLLFGLIAVAISWLYATRVLIPWNANIGRVHDGVVAQMGDLYSPWVGARELLIHRRNPYGEAVSHEIQTAFYGRPIDQKYGSPGAHLINEQRFAYPVYVVFLLAPTLHADFTTVQRWAPFALALFVAVSVLLCLSMLRWSLPWEGVAAIVLFALASPQMVQGLRQEQLAVLVGFLLTAGAWCVTRNQLPAAGILLALSTVKPQMSLLPLCWFLIWTIGDWRKRWLLLAGFLATLGSLIAFGELLLPGWIGYFFSGIAAYRRYAPTTSLLRVLLGDTTGEILGAVLILAALVYTWRNRGVTGDSPMFAYVLSALLIVAILTFPLFTPYNQVMLILPVVLLLHNWKLLPPLSRLVFIVIVAWPSIISALILLFPPRLDSLTQVPLVPSFLAPFVPLFLPLLLMTRRTGAPLQNFPSKPPFIFS